MRIIRRLGSLGFAVFLIAGLAVILTTSTLLESLYGTPFAQKNFYQAHWFDIFLGLVWVNIFCATLTRWPFKKRHTGFVITHIGILLMLIGCLLTRLMGEEGQMTLFENEAKGRMVREGFSLILSLPGGEEKTIDLEPKPVKRPAELPLKGSPFTIRIRSIWPSAREVRALEESPSSGANAAVIARLSSERLGLDESLTLIERDPFGSQGSSQELGPATFRLIRREKTSPGSPSARLILTQTSTGKTASWPVSGPIDRAEWPEAGLVIKNLAYYRHARVENNKLIDVKDAAQMNPAVEFEVTDGAGHSEHHTRFSLFPDFNTLRGGRANDAFGLQVTLEMPSETPPDETGRPGFRFLLDPNGDWSTQSLSSKTGAGEITPLKIGSPIATGWMDMKVTVEKVFAHAVVTRSIREAPDGTTDTPAVELGIRREGKPEEIRQILLGRSIIIGQDDASIRIASAPRSSELPFSLILKDFRKIDYPGTASPASFESDVTLRDPSSGVTIERTISMNKPLDYAGYRVFQSSYIQDESLGEASVFTIAKNPGIGLIYTGAVIILAGVLLLFYWHPFFNKRI